MSCVCICLNINYQYSKVNVSRTRAKLAHTAGAYPGFLSMKPTRNIATPPGRTGCKSITRYPQHFVAGTCFLLGGEKHCESKVSCPRTQHNDPGREKFINLLYALVLLVCTFYHPRGGRHYGSARIRPQTLSTFGKFSSTGKTT